MAPVGAEPAGRRVRTGAGRVETGADVARLLATVNTGYRVAASGPRTVAAVEAARAAAPADLDRTGVLPVRPAGLAGLLPWPGGIRRGAVVTVAGGTSLLIALLSGPSQAGHWSAVLGVPTLGAVAAAEAGIDLARLALIPDPGPDWPRVAGMLLVDGFDLVAIAPPGPAATGLAHSLAARARHRGAVLVPVGVGWPAPDLTLQITEHRWTGITPDHRGRLRHHQAVVTARGRGLAARPRDAVVSLTSAGTPPLPGPPTGGRPGDADRAAATRQARLAG